MRERIRCCPRDRMWQSGSIRRTMTLIVLVIIERGDDAVLHGNEIQCTSCCSLFGHIVGNNDKNQKMQSIFRQPSLWRIYYSLLITCNIGFL